MSLRAYLTLDCLAVLIASLLAIPFAVLFIFARLGWHMSSHVLAEWFGPGWLDEWARKRP